MYMYMYTHTHTHTHTFEVVAVFGIRMSTAAIGQN